MGALGYPFVKGRMPRAHLGRQNCCLPIGRTHIVGFGGPTGAGTFQRHEASGEE